MILLDRIREAISGCGWVLTDALAYFTKQPSSPHIMLTIPSDPDILPYIQSITLFHTISLPTSQQSSSSSLGLYAFACNLVDIYPPFSHHSTP